MGVPAVLDHVVLAASDFPASVAFYDAALDALGLVRLQEHADEEEDGPALEAVGWGRPDESAALWLVSGPAATRGVHVSLRAESAAEVEAFFAAAIGAGGAAHAAPRPWVLYRRGEFRAAVIDPDGNLLEAVAVE